MFAPDSCRNQLIRFLQCGWFVTIFLLPIIAFSFFNAAAFAEESKSTSAPGSVQAKSAVKRSDSSAPKAADAGTNSDKKTTVSDDSEGKTVDAAEMLKAMRKSYEAKNGVDNSNDDLILSQSSGYVFLNRKKVRDVADNILDHWFLSSFEDDFNLTLIVFDAISVKPLSIELDSDIDARLSLKNNDNPLLSYSETARTLNPYINFPIPESVMVYVNENSEDIVDIDSSSLLPETFSSLFNVVLLLGLLGFSILGYVVYRIVVWAFVLDQNKEYDLQKGRNEEVVAPVDMYKAYYYQMDIEDKEK